ncbi:MAG: hypothetical protein NT062_24895 [Proteobacteria bacterium]|nr:hypothetical protein [Pseudomonadota bacterium]
MFVLPYFLFQKFHQLAIDARRASRTRTYVAYAVLAGASAGVMLAAGLALSATLFVYGLWWMSIFTILFMVVRPLATLLIRHVAVPLGWMKVAYYLGAVFASAGKDTLAYGYVVAAWALSRRPSGVGEAWLATQRASRRPLGDAEVAMTALITAGRGDADNARLLMRSTTMMVEVHPAVRELVGEWLAVDAAARGAWRELLRDATDATFPATPLTFFLEGCATRQLGAAGAPGDRELWARWLLAPHRRTTRALRDAACAVATADPSTASTTGYEDVAQPTSLPDAIAAHVALGVDPTLASRTRFASTVTGWDRALDDADTRAWLARRALELEAPLGSADRVIRDVTAMVVDDLVAIADAAKLGAPVATGRLGPVGEALSRRLRHGRLDVLEAAFSRWADRRTNDDLDDKGRQAIDEWREFVALHAAYTTACEAGGLELRRLAFPHAFTTGNHMAAWLWNKREEYAMSHAISRWLLDEALAVGDAEAIELGHRNCALEIPTRLGRIKIG